ncbi:hypothetical protein [Aequorivita antarctica]|uniref:Uncharacterized protein n=1 Tax=Aequorivita antarctica TaxID=153266 RepID=A0A5C6YYP6_9FLAO|nr:hypothetical protein [Aequorivita antarctica]TXD72171.1 hypothetical protein ESU54_14065 [Aequorivita antarctica]SRX75143.1 hypothetical protein AEQU3_02137 [Aequorivita antarctica]
MTERVKLIWDFHGPNSKHIAEHHAKHLTEFAEAKKLENAFTGKEEITPMHHIAYFVVDKSLMNTLRETLKPTRGQIYDNP